MLVQSNEIIWWSTYKIVHIKIHKFSHIDKEKTTNTFIIYNKYSKKFRQDINISMKNIFNRYWKLILILKCRSYKKLLHTYFNEKQFYIQSTINFYYHWIVVMSLLANDKTANFKKDFTKDSHVTNSLSIRYSSSILTKKSIYQYLVKSTYCHFVLLAKLINLKIKVINK